MLTDRQIVECAVLAWILHSVLVSGGEGEEGRFLVAEAKTAALEPLQGLTPAAKAKLIRRIDRAGVSATCELEHATVGKVGLVAFELTKTVVESGYLQMHEGSAFDRAMNNVLAYLEPLAAEQPALHDSARKQARRALQRLQRDGYFSEVPL